MQYNQPLDQPSNSNASYIDGNPAAGINGSIVPAASLEFDQREVVEVITRANARGYTDFFGVACAAPSNNDLAQLRKAIEGFVKSLNQQLIIDSTMTFRVHGTGADFSDLNAAMSYLRVYYITPRGSVILQCAGAQPGAPTAVQYVYSQSIVFSHPNNNRISVFGATMLAEAPRDPESYAITGPSPPQRAADMATNLSMLRAKFATELHLVGGATVIIGTAVPCLMHFDGFLLSGDGSSANGIVFDATFGNLNPDTYSGIACVGFGGAGVILELGCSVSLAGVADNENNMCPIICIGNGSAGVAMGDGSYLTMYGNCLCLGNGSDGFLVYPRGGAQMDGALHSCCNAGSGINMLLAPTLYVWGAMSGGSPYRASAIWKNGNNGVTMNHAQAQLYVDCGAGANANTNSSVWAGAGSMCEAIGGDLNISAHCFPAFNTVGNGNSLIT